jgi:hypothetical protein
LISNWNKKKRNRNKEWIIKVLGTNKKKKKANETHKQKICQQKEILKQQSNFKKVIAEQKLDYNDYQM